jgi:hypothetical protein
LCNKGGGKWITPIADSWERRVEGTRMGEAAAEVKREASEVEREACMVP